MSRVEIESVLIINMADWKTADMLFAKRDTRRSLDLHFSLQCHADIVHTILSSDWVSLKFTIVEFVHSEAFSFASSSVWNSIPNDVRCAPSLSSFKSRLKTYLFRSVCKD